jgi:hypothetical protein
LGNNCPVVIYITAIASMNRYQVRRGGTQWSQAKAFARGKT